ncbi:MAG: hypothetical protein QM705_07105 [Ancrocorticia sp.]
MRIYIPATNRDLKSAPIEPRVVHAVTRALEHALGVDEDSEVVEAVAMNAAADDSLRLVGTARSEGVAVAPRRCVIVAVVPDAHVSPLDPESYDLDEHLPSAVYLNQPVGWKKIESIHVDDLEAEQDVAEAADGDEAAFDRVIDEDLMWYDVAERDALARMLAAE